MPAAWQLNPREVGAVAAYVRSLGTLAPESLPGDAARGKLVYGHGGCANCHMIAGAGTGFGPELTDVGSRRSGAFLKQTLLHPDHSLPEHFEYLSITPTSGAPVRGIRVNEDSFTIQIKDASGRFYSFRKDGVRELRRLEHQTPMPPYGELPAADLDDLVAYLASLRGRA